MHNRVLSGPMAMTTPASHFFPLNKKLWMDIISMILML